MVLACQSPSFKNERPFRSRALRTFQTTEIFPSKSEPGAYTLLDAKRAFPDIMDDGAQKVASVLPNRGMVFDLSPLQVVYASTLFFLSAL